MFCQCGMTVGGLTVVRGLIRTTTYRCECGKVWKKRELVQGATTETIELTLTRLQKSPPGFRTAEEQHVIDYLALKLIMRPREGEEPQSSTGRRLADLWERNFILSCTKDS